MKFVLPTGIGDSCWALTKIQAVRDKQERRGPIDIYLVGGEGQIDTRAIDFVRRFSFVNSVRMCAFHLHKPGTWIRPDGTYDYIDDGWYDFGGKRYCVLIPNAPLERGERLESWLPQYPIRWDIWRDFAITEDERFFAEHLAYRIGPYCVFYPGPLTGNTEDGHNRGALWKPEDWVALGRRVRQELGLQIVVVGAPYDASYYQWLLGPALGDEASYWWHNLIGKTNLGELWSVTSQAKFTISYQAGVGIVNALMGNPTACFWRPYGDSISATHFLSFNEKMAHAWCNPKYIADGTYLPLIYGRHGVDYIMAEIRARGWCDARPAAVRVGA